MSTLKQDPKVNKQTQQQPIVKNVKREWVDWLNEVSGSNPTPSTPTTSTTTPSKTTPSTTTTTPTTSGKKLDIDAERRRSYKSQIDLEESRAKLIGKEGDTKIKDCIVAARNLIDPKVSLVDRKNNEAAMNAITQLTRAVNEATKNVCPGIGSVLKEVAVLEISFDFEVASKLSGTVGASLADIKNDLKKKPVNLAQVSQSVEQLKTTCYQLVREQSFTKDKIQAEQKLLDQLSEKIGKQSQNLQSACQVQFAKATEAINKASALPFEPKGTASEIKTQSEEHLKLIDAILKESEQLRQDIETIETNFKKQPLEKQADFGKLVALQTKIKSLKPAALAAGFAGDIDGKLNVKVDDKGFSLVAMQEFLDSMITKIETTRKAWEDKKVECNKLMRFADQALAAHQLNVDEYVSDKDSRSTVAQQLFEQATAARQAFDAALGKAKQKLYGEATTLLTNALLDTGPLGKLKTLQGNAAELLNITKTDPKDLKARKEAFNTSIGDVTDKSRIRFDDDAMSIMMGVGIGIDEKGEQVYSEQFKLMQAQLEVGLKMWHKLCDGGCDPFKAAERAFEGIPENFWPPSAVRVIAMFRKAEEEFAGEREAAELEEALSERVVKKVDITGEVLQHAGERTADAFNGMLAHFKTTHANELKGLSDQQIAEKANTFFKDTLKIDFKDATKAVGGLAAGLGAINGAYKVVKDSKDIYDAVKKGQSYDPEVDSPVKLKLAEFERNRAIWHLLSDMADTVISALGPATDAVPALGLLGDAKSLVLDVADAYQYFQRLREVKAIKSIAKTDPESLAELALANEAEKLGLLRNEKAFTAAIAVMKIIGQGLDMGGITAAAGFGVKAGATVLMYCGKGVFTLIRWNKRRNAIKILAAARANPTDINCVERVFEKCTMYSRFLLADGALNGDAWCRQYILKRGLKDSDLDNPNTSTAILREYLNVTFQTKSGDAEKDDDLGTAKREKKEKEARPSEELEYPNWQATTAALTLIDFNKQYDSAVRTGNLIEDKAALKEIRGLLTRLEQQEQKVTEAIDAANEAFSDYSEALKKSLDTSDLALTAETTMEDAYREIRLLNGICEEGRRLFTAGYVPVTTTPDSSGKNKIHATFRSYLQELEIGFDLVLTDAQAFQRDAAKRSMALKLNLDVTAGDLPEKAREEFMRLDEELKVLIKDRSKAVKKTLEEGWQSLTLDTNCAKKGTKEKLIKTLAKQTGIAEKEYKTAIDEAFEKLKKPILQTAAGMCVKIVTDYHRQRDEAKKQLKDKKQTEAIKKLTLTLEKRIKVEVLEYANKRAIAMLSDEFDEVASQVFSAQTVAGKLVPDQPIKMTRDYWVKQKTYLDNAKWKFVRTGVGPQLEVYEEAKANWNLLPKDEVLQGEYNAAFGKLLKLMNNIPLLRTDGLEVPNMRKFKADLIAVLKQEKSDFDKRISDPTEPDPKSTSDGWVIPDSKLNNWPLTEEGWHQAFSLAKQHGWEGHNSERSIARAFRHMEEALEDYEEEKNSKSEAQVIEKARLKAVKDAQSLVDTLTKWDPNTKMLRSKAEHKGIMKYQAKMITRVNQEIIGKKLKV